jgi:hypothetical protein
MFSTVSWFLATYTAFALAGWGVRAAGVDEGEGGRPVAAPSAALGSFLAFSQPASLGAQAAYGTGIAGYDSSRKAGLFEAAAEARLWGPVSLRGGAIYIRGAERARPSFGARLQALQESRNGIDGSFGVFYRPEGLTEPEGELEAVISVGGHLGATYLLSNLVYGQDPEGNERDGELRIGALRPVASRLLVGLDGRLRVALGSPSAKHEPTLDALVGPAATALVGPVAFLLQAGGSAVRLDTRATYGMFVLGGIGAAF